MWKLNPSLLADQQIFCQIVHAHHLFFDTSDHPDTNGLTFWNTCNVYMQGMLIKLALFVRKQRNCQTEDLLFSIVHADRLSKRNLTLQLSLALLQERQQIRNFYINIKTICNS